MNQQIFPARGGGIPSGPRTSSAEVSPWKRLADGVRFLRQNLLVWLLPTCLLTLAAAGYAIVRAPSWKASQALLVRDEAIGNLARPGQFFDNEARKTAQETVLEIARSHQVVSQALRQAGPPPQRSSTLPWPSPEEVEEFRDHLQVIAPGGAEFGRTEVIHLVAQGRTPERAISLTEAVCEQLIQRLQNLRDLKARSVLDELSRTRDLARADLEAATQELETMERQVGSDLGELRGLNDAAVGDSSLRAALTQVTNELRQVKNQQEANRQLSQLLEAARLKTENLFAAPNQLLESHPALRRLKDGLVDAQLRTAEMLGTMSPDHPRVLSAQAAEQEVRADLQDELAVALRSLAAERDVQAAQIRALEQQRNDLNQRLNQLAGMRARYGNLVAVVQQRTQILEQKEKELSDARASQAAAAHTSLLTRIDRPQTGPHPVGPGRSLIVLAGFVGGLLGGLGLTLLTVPAERTGRRWSDYVGFGRRATDRQVGRRGSDVRSSETVNPDVLTSDMRASDGLASDSPEGGRRASDRSRHGSAAADGASLAHSLRRLEGTASEMEIS